MGRIFEREGIEFALGENLLQENISRRATCGRIGLMLLFLIFLVHLAMLPRWRLLAREPAVSMALHSLRPVRARHRMQHFIAALAEDAVVVTAPTSDRVQPPPCGRNVPPKFEVHRCTKRTTALSTLSAALMIPANRAEAVTTQQPAFEGLRRFLTTFGRPKPEEIPRRVIERDFAVQLMRNSYNIADELDFMPMNEFQKRFFLFRQDEWEDYKKALPSVRVDLTDPQYFDFISFCQYNIIASGMQTGQVIFNELVDVNGSTVTVVRDSSLPASNDRLPDIHTQRFGERILAWADERFPKSWSPSYGDVSDLELLDGVRKVAFLFESQNYMRSSSLEPLEGTSGVRWSLVAPANLWSTKVFSQLRYRPTNDFEAKVLLAYLRRCGYTATYNTRVEGIKVIHEFRWEKNQNPRSVA